MIRLLALLWLVAALPPVAAAAELPRLKASENRWLLITADGATCFWLGAPPNSWELVHRPDREQALRLLDCRAVQRATVLQAVA